MAFYNVYCWRNDENGQTHYSRAGRFGLPGVGKQATPGWGGVTGPQLGVRSTILGPHHDIQIQVVTQPQRGVR